MTQGTHVKCITCGCETFEEEYTNPSDADICPHCFTDRLNGINRRESTTDAKKPQFKLRCIQAECELRLERAGDGTNQAEYEAYARILRMIEA